MSAAKTKAQKIVDENSVVVFSKSYCPYCRATKALLNEKDAKFFLMELDQVGTSTFEIPLHRCIDEIHSLIPEDERFQLEVC